MAPNVTLQAPELIWSLLQNCSEPQHKNQQTGRLLFDLFKGRQLLGRGMSQCIMDAVGYPLAGLLHPGVMQVGITQGGLTAPVP